MLCELCARALATVFVYAATDRRPGVHDERNCCASCTDDAVRALEGSDHVVGMARVVRWAS